MTFDKKNAENLVAVYLKKADERLESAKTLLETGHLEDSVSRSYYAILDAASACLIKKDIIPQSHAGAIRLFSLHYVKPGVVAQKYQRTFAKIEKARIEADYTHLRSFTKEESETILSESRDFVAMARKLVA